MEELATVKLVGEVAMECNVTYHYCYHYYHHHHYYLLLATSTTSATTTTATTTTTFVSTSAAQDGTVQLWSFGGRLLRQLYGPEWEPEKDSLPQTF